MSRGYNAYVDFLRPCASQSFEFLLLQDSKKLRLQLERNIADFIQEERTLMRKLKPANFLRNRAGEGSSLMAKQFAFEQAGRNSGAVELDERPILARTVIVNSPGNELFARARLAEQEHSRISPGHGFDHLQDAAKNRAPPNDPLEIGLWIQLFVE